MSDLHEKLLRWFEPGGDRGDLEDAIAHGEAALLAVVQLHAPEPFADPYCLGCRHDTPSYEHDVRWPCPTVRAIAEQLGVTP